MDFAGDSSGNRVFFGDFAYFSVKPDSVKASVADAFTESGF
jgi:hypothetical protein